MSSVIIGLVFFVVCLALLGMLLRFTWWILAAAWKLGPLAFALALASMVYWWCVPSSAPEPGSPAAYAAAARATELATGKPCDYACKVMIATKGEPFGAVDK